jgi:recombination protein RecA
MIYGKGIPVYLAMVDIAIDQGILKKKGAGWLSYKGETLGQGKEAVASLLEKNITLRQEITEDIMNQGKKGLGLSVAPSEEESGDDIGPPTKIEEGVFELEDD